MNKNKILKIIETKENYKIYVEGLLNVNLSNSLKDHYRKRIKNLEKEINDLKEKLN